jgi:hypothetical protein|tara:strand:- start:558 stop:695 length:138 start_codon:yes stop_codon:yes gene_type:complete
VILQSLKRELKLPAASLYAAIKDRAATALANTFKKKLTIVVAIDS